MRVLIVVPEQDRVSGNWVTALRFKQGLEAHDCKVVLHGTPLDDSFLIGEQISRFVPDVALLLHAYRSGQPWANNQKGGDIPYVVMLTGTDLNQGLHNSEQNQVIQSILQKSQAIVIQNPMQAKEFANDHPALAAKICKPTPGITLGEAPYDLYGQHELDKDLPLFLCPAGLRPVKGVLELLEMFDQVISEHPELQIAFCGPVLDQNYGANFLAAVEKRGWAHYLGAIPPNTMASVMRGADVILNNSHAEGLSNSLLEAATLGIPILATNIPGNATIVEHEFNGLLYDNTDEFISYALRLADKAQRSRLSHPESDRYSPIQEAEDLFRILRDAASHELLSSC